MVTSAGERPREICCLPEGVPPSTAGSTFPCTRDATAARRVTVWPEPGTNSPTAPRSAYVCGSNGGTTTTLTSAARAGAASAANSADAIRAPNAMGIRLRGARGECDARTQAAPRVAAPRSHGHHDHVEFEADLGVPVVTGDFESGRLSLRALPCPGHSDD